MANFTKAFTDFSFGEIDSNNVNIVSDPRQSKGGGLLDNVTLSDDRGFERRTGTLNVATTKYPVDTDNQNVVTHSFFVGKGLSFVCMMYIVDTTDLTSAQLTELENSESTTAIPDDSKVLVMDWYKSEGFTDTFINTTSICIDAENRPTPGEGYFKSVRVRDNSWFDLYGFSTTSFQNLLVFTHSSGSVMSFVMYYIDSEVEANRKISYFAHNDGLNITNREYWTDQDVSNAFSRPFETANLNPRVALFFERATAPYSSNDVWFRVTPQYFDKDEDGWFDWTTGDFPRAQSENPLGKRCDFLRITILNVTYILVYEGTYLTDTTTDHVNNMTAFNDHLYRVVAQTTASGGDLTTIVGTDGRIVTDFNVEAFSITNGFPENAIFYDQRLVYVRDGRYFNSAIGNAFFFNQFRFIQDEIEAVFVRADNGSLLLESDTSRLLVEYSNTKLINDPFDMTPLSSVIVDSSWINKGEEIEVGTYSEINTISGIDDSVYGFSSVKATFRGNYGSKKHISVKAGQDTVFVHGSDKELRNYFYNGQTRSQSSTNLNSLNRNLIRGLAANSRLSDTSLEISEVTFNQDTNTLYTIVRPNNTLLGCVYDRSSSKLCWHRINISSARGFKVDVTSSCFLRNDKSDSFTYITTKRGDLFYLEKFAKAYEPDNFNAFAVYGGTTQVSDLPYYLDFSKGFVGATSDTWNIGLEYADTTVSVLADGFWIDDVECSSTGEIVLDRVVRTIVVGYKYKSRFRTLDVEPVFGGEVGNVLHHLKSINYVHLRLVHSYGGSICTGNNLSNLEKIPYDMDDMIVDTNLMSFTGALDIHLSQDAGQKNNVYLETDAPYPFRVEAIVIKGESNER